MKTSTEWSSFYNSPPAGVTLTAPVVWTGASGDGLWLTAANWNGGSVPATTDDVAFNDSCSGANCNATINTAVTINSLMMASTYTGTITQGSGNVLDVGSEGWTINGGTFVGSNASIRVRAFLEINAGSFTSTSDSLRFDMYTTRSGSSTRFFKIASGATFSHNNGLINFDKFGTGTSYNHSYMEIGTASLEVYDLQIGKTSGDYAGPSLNLSNVPKLIVKNNLTFGDMRSNDGSFEVEGSVLGYSSTEGQNNSVKMIGSSNVTLQGANLDYINLEIAKTAAKVTQATAAATLNSVYISSGEYDMAGFNLTVTNALTLDAGTTLTRNGGTLTYGTLTNNGTLNP